MAKKKGICVNLDCDNYRKEVEVETGAEFECPLCHQHLKEKPEVVNGSHKGLIIGIVLAVLAVAAIVFIPIGRKPTSQINPPGGGGGTTVTPPDTFQGGGGKDTSGGYKDPGKGPVDLGDPGRGAVDLGYAFYSGDLKNGKPHGHGILTYKKSQKIVPSEDFVAKPGDTFDGEFRDGKISGLGYWNHDGNQTVVKP